MGILIRFVVTFLSVWVAALVLPASLFRMDDLASGAVFAAVLAILNALVRPFILLLTCPIQVLTLGLSVLIINAAIFMVAASGSRLFGATGIEVGGFVGALVAALVVSLVSWGVSLAVRQ